MTFRLTRALPGHVRAGRCRLGARRGRGRRCVRYRPLGTGLDARGAAGRNSSRLPLVYRGKWLRRGRYRLEARAIDAAGNRSQTKQAPLRIVRSRANPR